MSKFANLILSTILVAGIGTQFVSAAEAQQGTKSPDVGQSDAQPDFNRDEDNGSKDPIADILTSHANNARSGGFHCSPSSTNESGSGVCGLPQQSQENICSGRGGGSSTGPDGGHTCTVN